MREPLVPLIGNAPGIPHSFGSLSVLTVIASGF